MERVVAVVAFVIVVGQAILNFNAAFNYRPGRNTDLRQIYLKDFQR